MTELHGAWWSRLSTQSNSAIGVSPRSSRQSSESNLSEVNLSSSPLPSSSSSSSVHSPLSSMCTHTGTTLPSRRGSSVPASLPASSLHGPLLTGVALRSGSFGLRQAGVYRHCLFIVAAAARLSTAYLSADQPDYSQSIRLRGGTTRLSRLRYISTHTVIVDAKRSYTTLRRLSRNVPKPPDLFFNLNLRIFHHLQPNEKRCPFVSGSNTLCR